MSTYGVSQVSSEVEGGNGQGENVSFRVEDEVIHV